MLQTFRGLGRGKGFAVESRGSGLEDRDLCLAIKPKLLTLFSVFADRGYVLADDLTSIVGRAADRSGTKLPSEQGNLKARVSTLEQELKAERTTNQFLKQKAADLLADLARERDKVQRAILRIAALEHRLSETQAMWLKVVTASRKSLLSLQSSRRQLASVPFASKAFEPLLRDLRELAILVREIDVHATIRAGREPAHGAQR